MFIEILQGAFSIRFITKNPQLHEEAGDLKLERRSLENLFGTAWKEAVIDLQHHGCQASRHVHIDRAVIADTLRP